MGSLVKICGALNDSKRRKFTACGERAQLRLPVPSCVRECARRESADILLAEVPGMRERILQRRGRKFIWEIYAIYYQAKRNTDDGSFLPFRTKARARNSSHAAAEDYFFERAVLFVA